ncbi:hypothetical protein D1839_01185 [Roseburia sp. 1XD42-34]|nr:hypothetical protein [Roseburia sp. 1XD42-34]RKI81867.1 hypothetical protein D7V87_01185 [Clostridium sp. 1xD42-85]
MNKQKLLLHLYIFLSALCLLISVFTKWMIPTMLALILATIAQSKYRKWYPHKARSYKELIQKKYEKEQFSKSENK